MFSFLKNALEESVNKNTGSDVVSAVAVSAIKERIYLDYASITPVDPRVIKEFSKNTEEFFANPSSLYKEGVSAYKKLHEARARIAKCLEVHADEVYFTSGGTESNNLAIQGMVRAYENLFKAVVNKANKNKASKNKKKNVRPHIVSTTIEHPSVVEILEALKNEGRCDVTYVPIDTSGVVDPKEIKKALRPETLLVSVMYANNEIGTIQPIHEIAKVIRAYRAEKNLTKIVSENERNEKRPKKNSNFEHIPYLHVDACQAAAYETLRMPYLGADLLTLDGSKIYGPRSSGVLYIKRGINLNPLMYGGSQEGGDQNIGLRPGTEHVANALGFALALETCQEECEKESVRLRKLSLHIYECIKNKVPNVSINGDIERRLPNNINICLAGIDAEYAVLRLDAKGVCVSSVTSCRSKNEDSSSYVIAALGAGNTREKDAEKDIKKDAKKILAGHEHGEQCSKSSLRITLGRFTTEKEIKVAIECIIGVLTTMI